MSAEIQEKVLSDIGESLETTNEIGSGEFEYINDPEIGLIARHWTDNGEVDAAFLVTVSLQAYEITVES
jgi:hypothetical protein